MSGRTTRILVVDDEADICRNMADILGEFGYEVDTAMDGAVALEMVRERSYDIALLDLRMPGMDGIELYRQMKRLRSGAVAILVTAHAAEETERHALEAGAWRVLPKPVRLPTLMDTVQEALGRPLLLVVDDDRELCANLLDMLRERRYRVSTAHDQQEAAQRLREADHDLVLIDMKLPGGDGRAVFRLVRDANPNARTVLITGYRSETSELIDQVLGEGADAVSYKPFDVPRLLSMIAGLAMRVDPCKAGEAAP